MTSFSGGFKPTGGRLTTVAAPTDEVAFAIQIAQNDAPGFPSFGVAFSGDVVNNRTLRRNASENTMQRIGSPGCFGQFLTDFCNTVDSKEYKCQNVKNASESILLPFIDQCELRTDGALPLNSQNAYEYTLRRLPNGVNIEDDVYNFYGRMALPGAYYTSGPQSYWRAGEDLGNDINRTFFQQADDNTFITSGGESDLVWNYPLDAEGNGMPFWEDSLIKGEDDAEGYARWYVAGYVYKKEVSFFIVDQLYSDSGRSNWFFPTGGIDRAKMRIPYPDPQQPWRDYTPAYNSVDYYRIFDPATFYVRDHCLDNVSFRVNSQFSSGTSAWAVVVHQSIAPIYRMSNRYEECYQEVLGTFVAQAVIARSESYPEYENGQYVQTSAAPWQARSTDGQPLFYNNGNEQEPTEGVPVEDTLQEREVYENVYTKAIGVGIEKTWDFLKNKAIQFYDNAVTLSNTTFMQVSTVDENGQTVVVRQTWGEFLVDMMNDNSLEARTARGSTRTYSRAASAAMRQELNAIGRQVRMRQAIAGEQKTIKVEDIVNGATEFKNDVTKTVQSHNTGQGSTYVSEVARKYGTTNGNGEQPVLRQSVGR